MLRPTPPLISGGTAAGADVFVTAQADAVKYVLLRWNADLGEPLRILGDDWERAYGTLEWRGIVKQRIMPWYFLIAYTDGVCGYGVRVRPSALCSFTVDNGGITLRLDLRNGTKGRPVIRPNCKGGDNRLRILRRRQRI